MESADGPMKLILFFSSRRRHTRLRRDWSSDVCSSDLDAADVIGELPEEIQEEVIAKIEEEDPEQAHDIVDLLTYDEDTAGGLMAKEMVVVNQNWTITNCLREMRKQAEELDDVYAVYVIDDDRKLLGLLSLSKMLVSPADAIISDKIGRAHV